ncbi:quinon protein alcohol dehydrogenase-like superfamily [Suillus subaureus]|uniref:Quinon protein alcohol dehydrogenase-like superfamily n=1 Tax=Suillus subaureus TaxID=48587 RepID=A0A9P7EAJ8_9AGAM|nr:quinon protein alcohol dehydrogenase-like superfamily [Suillus subaureus]KAG1815641.1 quinon protein alcohol dehydrogenase-like superfamily [Suillus subaureus]
MISGSGDKTARRWDLRAGKEIEKAREVCEQGVHAVGVSRDGRWVVTGGGYFNKCPGELKICDVRTGIMRRFEDHSMEITCIDMSANSSLLASGSIDCTVRIWELDTGKLVAGPFKIDNILTGVGAVRFSQDLKKLAVKSRVATWLEVWDVEAQKLDVRMGKDPRHGLTTHAPVFWTTKDKTIVAALNIGQDLNASPSSEWHKAIHELDALTLQTVGAPFEGHTIGISDLALSFDCALLASASWDNTIKLWAFQSRQLLASFDVQDPFILIIPPNSHQLVYSTYAESEIHICDIPPKIIAIIWPNTSESKHHNILDVRDPYSSTPSHQCIFLRSDATRRAVPRKPVISPVTSFTPRPQRPSHTTQQRDFFRYLRMVLPSRTNAHWKDHSRDLLDFPATSPLPRNSSLSAQETAETRSRMDLHENLRHTAQSSATAPTTFKARLYDLWMGHALPHIVDVPPAQGKERNAAADAPPKNNRDWIPYEDYVPSRPPSPNPDSQPHPPFIVQINTGEHGRSRLCGCF